MEIESNKRRQNISFFLQLIYLWNFRPYLELANSNLIIARILINLLAVKELFFEKDKTVKKTPKKVCELSKMRKFHLNYLLKR